ncbi:hypothetical protein NFI96_029012, partial [Prochilodus magdalenae]
VVSSVEVEDSCFSGDKRRVSCSSDGDQVRLSWTLSGIGLGHQLADGNNTLLLDKEGSGNVTCYIENHISRSRTTVELHKCPAIVLLTVGVLGIICLLSLLGGFHIYARICMNKRTKQHSTAAESKALCAKDGEVMMFSLWENQQVIFIQSCSTGSVVTQYSHSSCNTPFVLVLTTGPPHRDSLGVSTKTKAGLVTEDDPLPFGCTGDAHMVFYSSLHPLMPRGLTSSQPASVRENSGLLTRVPVCRFNQTDPCYGAVGHPLYLQLEPEDELTLKKTSDLIILKVINKKVTQNHPDYLRWQFVPDNRSVIINRTEKRDSGSYTLETYDSGGVARGRYLLQLVTEGVVSSVKVTYSCSSIEKRRVYCSSDGENVHYNWTFSGTLHTDQPADENQTLLLDKDAVGSVTCYAQNHVSQEHKTIKLDPCPDMLLIAMGSSAVLLIVLAITVYLIYRKKQAGKKTDPSQDGGEMLYAHVIHKPTGGADKTGSKAQAEDDSVEYATVVTQSNKKKQRPKEDEVHYGELVFNSGGAKQRNEQPKQQPKEQDECVYSQVHR